MAGIENYKRPAPLQVIQYLDWCGQSRHLNARKVL
jgi:hypothetical protein